LKSIICYVDGQYLPLDSAGLPVADLLVQRGYGIFDFLRVAKDKPLFLEDHLARFYNSAQIMRLSIKETKEDLIQIVNQLVTVNQLDYSGIRFIVSGGDAADGYTITAPRLVVLQQPLAMPPDTLPLEGIKLVTKAFQRQLARVKTTDYLMAIYLQPWMKQEGADDILYYSENVVRECPRSNFFIVKDKKIITTDNHMLLGITRKNILRVAAHNGLTVECRDLSLEELSTADEAFISSSTKRITAVKQIDDCVLPPITKASLTYQLFELLKALEIE